jgi:hypothetical protein
MHEPALRDLIERIRDGRTSAADALAALAPLARPGGEAYWRTDHARVERCGLPEAILCRGKDPSEVARIAREMVDHGHDLLATRADEACWEAVRPLVPDAAWHPRARVICRRRPDAPAPVGLVAVVTAGTSDIPVAEEARLTAEVFGSRVAAYYDIGVAGVHRTLQVRDELNRASAIIVVAGMEGALASVIGGLTRRPVIGVPTSVGYGASFGGLAALLGMLNACAASVTVVNIDNGFGSGAVAHLINVQTVREPMGA